VTSITEHHVEQAMLEWLAALGWEIGHGPDVSPPDAKTPGTERNSYREVALKHRLRHAIRCLNPHILASVQYEFSKRRSRQFQPSGHRPTVVNRSSDLATTVFSRSTASERQTRSLAEVCDTPLPHLISGKLCLPEAKILTDEVSS
jgi:hypothetical protein